MAHEFRCQTCGHQEAEHMYPDDYPGVCLAYVSPDPEGEELMWLIIGGEDVPVPEPTR